MYSDLFGNIARSIDDEMDYDKKRERTSRAQEMKCTFMNVLRIGRKEWMETLFPHLLILLPLLLLVVPIHIFVDVTATKN